MAQKGFLSSTTLRSLAALSPLAKHSFDLHLFDRCRCPYIAFILHANHSLIAFNAQSFELIDRKKLRVVSSWAQRLERGLQILGANVFKLVFRPALLLQSNQVLRRSLDSLPDQIDIALLRGVEFCCERGVKFWSFQPRQELDGERFSRCLRNGCASGVEGLGPVPRTVRLWARFV